MYREGLLIIVSGPSGAGKGTALNLLRQLNDNIRYSISATTRKPRQGEIDGQNYFFKTVEEFELMIKNEELVEWVQYCENYYGTPKKCVDDFLKAGYDVILEIEVKGALNIKERFPDSVSIFILPPSFEELKRRIEGRGTESADVIEKRLAKAKEEMYFINRYDYIVINDSVENAAENMNSILTSEKLKFSRNRNVLRELGIET